MTTFKASISVTFDGASGWPMHGWPNVAHSLLLILLDYLIQSKIASAHQVENYLFDASDMSKNYVGFLLIILV